MTGVSAEGFTNDSASFVLQPPKNIANLLSVFFLLLKAANNLLYLSVLSIFLEKAGATSLPWVYLIVNAAFIAIQFQFMTRIVGKEGHWLLSLMSFPSALLSFGAAWLFPTESVMLLVGFFIVTMIVDLTTNQAFTAMLNHFLGIGESKRLLPVIYAAGSLGFIISGLLLKFILDFLGLKGLFVINGFLVILAAVILRMLKPAEDARLAESETPSPSKDAASEAIDESSMQHPLARLLIISSFLIIFNKYLVDFLFAASISSFFTSTNDLASFMGVFGAATDFAVIALQTFVMNRVFSKFPIGRVLAFMPIILTLLCILASFSLKFAVIAAVQFLVLLNSKNFTVPATTILMGAIPQKNRVYYRRDMSIACSVSSAVVAGFLLIARGRVGHDSLFVIAAATYFVMAGIHVLLDRAYLATLRKAFIRKEESQIDDQVASLRFLNIQERLDQLKELLADENPRVRASAIEAAAVLPANYAVPMLEPMFEHEADSRCLTVVARTLIQISPDSSASHIFKIIRETTDDRLRSDIIEALGKAHLNVIGEENLLGFLEHGHHRVCASAVITIVRLTRQQKSLESAMRKLVEMARDSRELMRASAAAVMGELGLPLFVPALGSLAAENNVAVAGNAATALARIHTPAALSVLKNMLAHPNAQTAVKASELLAASARENISCISRLLTGITADERRKLSVKLRSGRHQESHDLLAAILCVDSPEKRKNLVAVLETADRKTIEYMKLCVKMMPGDSVELDLAPIINAVIIEHENNLPDLTPLAHALAGGALEKPAENMQFFAALNPMLSALWCELSFLIDSDWPCNTRELWQKRVLAALKMLACMSVEPATMIKSMKELFLGKAFAKAMAAEYIEARAGRKLALQILPLLDASIVMTSQKTIEMAVERMLDVNCSSVDEAKQRLANLKIYESVRV
ncbi:MAG: MFS transporter [Erysipelotrichia bacterium]|nr:MFS transporter [Erysipelotrichia bacterium]